MNPRLRRLIADGQSLATEYAGHPHVTVTALEPDPAAAFRVSYRLQGVTLDTAGQPVVAGEHHVVIRLGARYPREQPLAVTESLVFHPNFGANVGEEICIGDYWSPARSLVDIVATIGELLQYRQFNVRSPLNAIAARWAAANEGIFPIGDVGLYQAEPTVTLLVRAETPTPAPTVVAS